MGASRVDKLTGDQPEQVLEFLLFRMDGRTRALLMAHLPVAYARLFPNVDRDVILAHVATEMEAPGAAVGAWSARAPRVQTVRACSECGELIPDHADSEINRYHGEPCSLYPANVVDGAGA